MEIEKLFNRDEMRRLEKAAKDKNKIKLAEWAGQFEKQVSNFYEQRYKEVLADSIDSFFVAIVYTLHFNEKCKFGNARVCDFMSDLMATIEGFKDGGYSPEEYREKLKKDKIYFNN